MKTDKQIKKTLGRFKLHYFWHFERERGLRQGFLAAFMHRAFDWSLQFDIGGRETNQRKSQRAFVAHYIGYQRKAIIEELREPNLKWSKRENLRRQLLGLRVFRERTQQMIAKGDKEYAESTKQP